ncbi:MAG: 23S rRNA (adenine(2503)-C(2))-methyltransferase RlmN [Mollicutes bacterium]|nr:23S rRNA (adenine(2503)-C(2))-methyltransferase RlmN [Mollicutes bacterium]
MGNIFNYEKEDLEALLEKRGYKKFVASQVIDWVYDKKVYDPLNFSNISSEVRNFLKEKFSFGSIKIKKVQEDEDVKKFLFELHDNEFIETVLMYHDYGLSICISSQVGCNMGCAFCESGRLKKTRNLEVSEMIEQIILVSNYVNKKINSVVVMGIGEPFDNYDNLIKALKIINNPKMLNIGARHITVSTCGIVPKIYEFSKLGLQVNLAISLHASNDEVRNKIMPISKVYDYISLHKAIKDYINVTGRRVSLEYILLKDINDDLKYADELALLFKNMNIYINLISYNKTNNNDINTSDKKQIDLFFDRLKKRGLNVTMRRKFGDNISAACGQLRSKEI